MKILFFVIMMSLTLSVAAKDVALAISPFQTTTEAEQRFADIVTFYTQLELGDTLIVINGADSSAIATLSVPQNTAYTSPKARLKHARPELIKIKAFTERFSQGSRTLGGMDVPSVINRIATSYPYVTDIFLVGSALYDEPSQNINMAISLRIPSDAFLASSPLDSVFGVVGRENVLQGKRIHWLITNTSHDSMHSEAVKRFWFLHINGQSGNLVSFSHNFNAVTQRLLNGAQSLSLPYTINSNGKFEMQGIRQFVPEPTVSPQASVGKKLPLEGSSRSRKQNITVAIEWEGDGVDLDIYAQTPNTKPLYYRNPSNEYGQHYKDILSGGALAHRKRFETIEFNKAVDVRTLAVAVNVYSTPASTRIISGILRVQMAEQVYVKPFKFMVNSGNRGSDTEAILKSGVSSPHTQYFNALDIAGLNTVSEVSI